MNELTVLNALTMSSLEIAELVESRHDSVKRTIERLAERGVIQHPPLVDVKNRQGQTVREYRIGKRDSYVVVAQLSPEFTARLVDRWQELEEKVQPQFKLPQTFAEALRELADATEENTKLQKHNLALKREAEKLYTSAQALKRLAEKGDNLLLTEVAKNLKLSPRKELIHILEHEWKWIYRFSADRRLQARQELINKGVFVHVFSQIMVTPYGMTTISMKLEKKILDELDFSEESERKRTGYPYLRLVKSDYHKSC